MRKRWRKHTRGVVERYKLSNAPPGVWCWQNWQFGINPESTLGVFNHDHVLFSVPHIPHIVSLFCRRPAWQCGCRSIGKILFSAKDISISWPFRGHWILCCFPPFALWYFSFISTVRLQLSDEFSPILVPRCLSFLFSHGPSSTLLYQPFIIFHIASIMLPPLHLLNANVMHLQWENAVEEDSLLLFELVLSG